MCSAFASWRASKFREALHKIFRKDLRPWLPEHIVCLFHRWELSTCFLKHFISHFAVPFVELFDVADRAIVLWVVRLRFYRSIIVCRCTLGFSFISHFHDSFSSLSRFFKAHVVLLVLTLEYFLSRISWMLLKLANSQDPFQVSVLKEDGLWKSVMLWHSLLGGLLMLVKNRSYVFQLCL